MLWMVKNQFYTDVLKEHICDTRYLYKLMAKLTGESSVNPVSECEIDEKLAENFVNFCLEKTKKLELIWINLKNMNPQW